jgi:hypothetical protein
VTVSDASDPVSSPSSSSPPPSVLPQVFSINPLQGPAYSINVRIHDRTLPALVDSGAQINVLSDSTFSILAQRYHLSLSAYTGASPTAASGHSLNTAGVTTLPVTVCGVTQDVKFVVIVSFPVSVLIGSSFLEQFKADIKVSDKTFKIGRVTTPLLTSSARNESINLVSTTSVTIPPLSAAWVPVHTYQARHDIASGIVSCPDKLRHAYGLGTLNQLVTLQDGRGQVCIINATTARRRIPRHAEVGIIEETLPDTVCAIIADSVDSQPRTSSSSPTSSPSMDEIREAI